MSRRTLSRSLAGGSRASRLASHRAGGTAKASAGALTDRRREHVRRPARVAVDPASRARVRHQSHVRPDRLRRRHHAITNRTVDFGASDAPLTPDQFAACKGCVQIPWALGGNVDPLPASTALPDHISSTARRSRASSAATIKNWNDAGASRRSTRARTCRTSRSRRSTAATTRARRTTSPST